VRGIHMGKCRGTRPGSGGEKEDCQWGGVEGEG
jgi:hypothetical protein